MNLLWKSTIVVFLLLTFSFLSNAGPGNKPAVMAARSNNHRVKTPTEPASEMLGGLAMNGEARTKELTSGLWGGDHISMEVTDRRTTIEYDCARGTIDQRITLDRRGRFDVSGMQFRERGAPARQDGQPAGSPARFSGQVNGTKMNLTVRDSATKTLIGDFTLVYGSEPKLTKCM